jgi:hypothetical protein
MISKQTAPEKARTVWCGQTRPFIPPANDTMVRATVVMAERTGRRAGMREVFRRIGRDLRQLRNIDAYAIALLVFVFAVLSMAGDILSDNARWAVLLIGVGVLVFRVTLPDHYDGSADDVLKDRTAFEDKPLSARLREASELWIFAPSAINLLPPQNCDTIRTTILAKSEGVVRVAVLDPAAETAVQFATRQLDDSLDAPSEVFRSSLDATVGQLQRMAAWQERGSFQYRLAAYSPGFSLVAIDPGARHGVVIVEFHGFHNQVTNTRMHIELTRAISEQWYLYWLGQFERIWQTAQVPAAAQQTNTSAAGLS